jgi:hypothetical protein
MGGGHGNAGSRFTASSSTIGVLRRRLREHRAELRRLGVDPNIYQALVPYVRWTRGEAVVEPHPTVTERLERTLGPRLHDLPTPIKQPSGRAVQAEVQRQRDKGVDAQIAPMMADVVLMQHAMDQQGRPAMFELETPPWEAATGAAVAAAALRHPTPDALTAADQYRANLDSARAYDVMRQGRDEAQRTVVEVRRSSRESARKGGLAEKKLRNVWVATCLIVAAQPRIQAKEAWEEFPDGPDLSPTKRADFVVYRDGDRLVDDAVGEGRTIGYEAFRGYVTDARKLLRSK